MMLGTTNIKKNEIYLLIKYIKSVLWREAKHLSYIEDARCLKVNLNNRFDIFCLRTSRLLKENFSVCVFQVADVCAT